MNSRIRTASALALGSILLLGLPLARGQSAFTQWTFDSLAVGTNLSPAPSTGTGTTSSLGMGLFTGPDTSNIDGVVGTDNGSYDGLPNNTGTANNMWRIVGSNGWNNGAAIGTQGAQFLTSTVGQQGITAQFDLYITAQGESSFQAQYTSDGTTWINAPLTYAGSLIAGNGAGSVTTNSSNPNIVNGTYFQAGVSGAKNDAQFDDFTVNLTGISAVNNDPNFGLRIVNAATGSAVTNLSLGTALNNTSGNWRIDNVTFEGQVIPEPSTWALIAGCAVLGWAVIRRSPALQA